MRAYLFMSHLRRLRIKTFYSFYRTIILARFCLITHRSAFIQTLIPPAPAPKLKLNIYRVGLEKRKREEYVRNEK